MIHAMKRFGYKTPIEVLFGKESTIALTYLNPAYLSSKNRQLNQSGI